MTTGLSKLAALRDAEPLSDSHWPGAPHLRLKIRTLTCSQVLECRAAAEEELKGRGVADTVLNADAKEEEIATQILFRVLRDFDDPRKPFAVDAQDLRDNMTPDARAEMIVQFNEHRQATDPWPDELGGETLAAIEAAIKKKDRKGLRSFGSAVLSTLLLTIANRLENSPTGKSESSSE